MIQHLCPQCGEIAVLMNDTAPSSPLPFFDLRSSLEVVWMLSGVLFIVFSTSYLFAFLPFCPSVIAIYQIVHISSL